jgi:hypothetical protein
VAEEMDDVRGWMAMIIIALLVNIAFSKELL